MQVLARRRSVRFLDGGDDDVRLDALFAADLLDRLIKFAGHRPLIPNFNNSTAFGPLEFGDQPRHFDGFQGQPDDMAALDRDQDPVVFQPLETSLEVPASIEGGREGDLRELPAETLVVL